jgi:hypothetical protein
MPNKDHLWRVLRLLVTITIVLGTAVCACAVTERALYPFSLNANSGIYPNAVVFDTAGNLYGTTSGGGNLCTFTQCGVVFELSPTSLGWTESVLHYFSGLDGARPIGGLIFDADGSLYGTTANGGNSGCGGAGCGVIFELSPTSSGWTETILHTFTGGKDGGEPIGGLTSDAKGNLYGTASIGGSSSKCSSGCGTAYRLRRTSNAWIFGVLHSFTGGSDGAEPSAALVVNSTGSLYAPLSFFKVERNSQIFHNFARD